VQKVLDGQPAASVGRELGIGENLIYKWQNVILKNGFGSQNGAELSEIAALKKRNRELEMEVEILKKATLIFGRGSKDAANLFLMNDRIIRSRFCVGQWKFPKAAIMPGASG
jgi:transposase